jgi:hypothetical protein
VVVVAGVVVVVVGAVVVDEVGEVEVVVTVGVVSATVVVVVVGVLSPAAPAGIVTSVLMATVVTSRRKKMRRIVCLKLWAVVLLTPISTVAQSLFQASAVRCFAVRSPMSRLGALVRAGACALS